ncbi:MAG: thioredoxin domain-containing protein [Brevefilum sp.]|nr:thioredoxin domain-containing protein [Brevefilum sp.]
MPNHLSSETSPYLFQHKDNPVDWYPWNETALARARQENKPIFLSIGYSACHWCHVMAHESFEDPHTAQILNENFVSIKVDREERPDIDDIYMQAVVLLTGQGGWPLSVFLTPDLKPFYGGTYFPPLPRHGLPAFTQVLLSIVETWHNQPASISNNAEILTKAIQKQQITQEEPGEQLDLGAIVDRLAVTYDWDTGGWGHAPKFPQPMLIEFLIQQALNRNQKALKVADHLLDQMAYGGMYDVVGGGFHRYSTDVNWLIPHFEKMLYDNAQLASVYLHAYAITGKTTFLEVTNATLEFIQREMTSPEGGFYASIDADTPEGEGRYYGWQVDELREVLSPSEFNTLEERMGISAQGNFEHGFNILRYKSTVKDNPSGIRLGDHQSSGFDQLLLKLRETRAKRTPPGKDRKVITEWNAMAIRAFAEAGILLNRTDYLRTAERGAQFILNNLISTEGKLYRTWQNGKASQPATLADYAGLIAALHAVYQIAFDQEYFQSIRMLFESMQSIFESQDALYFDAAQDVVDLIVRPRSLQDNATPSGNALAAYAHWLISNYDHQPSHTDRAQQMIAQVAKLASAYPTSFGFWLQVAGLSTQTIQQVALVSNDDLLSLDPFLSIYRKAYRPFSIIGARIADQSGKSEHPAILDDRPTLNGIPTAYVCQGFICRNPVTDLSEFEEQLDQFPHHDQI